MSIFRGEQPEPGLIQLDQVSDPPAGYGGGGLAEGMIWNSSTQKQIKLQINGVTYTAESLASVNVTPVSASFASATTAQNLQTFAFPAGSLNVAGKLLYVYCAGTYTTTAASTPTITLAVKLGTLTLVTFTSGATTAAVTTFPWNLEMYAAVQTAGASGALEAHGIADVTLGATAAGAETSYNDVNAATVSTVDLTAAQTLAVTASMSATAASNAVASRLLVVEVGN